MRYGKRLKASHYLNMRISDITIYNRKANAMREDGGYVKAVYNNDVLIPVSYPKVV